MAIDLDAAEKKLLQAELLHGQLRSLSGEIALQMRQHIGGDYRLPLETYFSACLNAARSCYFVLARTGGKQFKEASSEWRSGVLDQRERTRFNSMLNLRDRDVHFGEMGAEVRAKMMEAENHGMHHMHYNAAIFGPRPMTEHVNPDGTTVRAPSLQGTIGLYVHIDGCLTEATSVCADFIAKMRSLLRAVGMCEAGKVNE